MSDISMAETKPIRVHADFNGLSGDNILCLSHEDTSVDAEENVIPLHEGMTVTVFDEDQDDQGRRGNLIATGIVEPSHVWLRCRSRWILRIDENGVRNESDLESAK
jgi:hypothetical protein